MATLLSRLLSTSIRHRWRSQVTNYVPCNCSCHQPPLRRSSRHAATPKAGSAFMSRKKEPVDISKIRNIGIMAHIDAGKTTATERMLFYSGFTRHLGDVDDGDTVMDYMVQERARGITITSAAITFLWNKYKINLIDTPGHVDFTVEVERALRVLDGAVAILDASAGVEAQTLTVWRQADKYHIPRLVFVNKMDKNGADFMASVDSLRESLHVKVLPVQLPVGEQNMFRGLVDLVNMEKLTWSPNQSQGRTFKREVLTSNDDMYDASCEWRANLVEILADIDDDIAELVLADTAFLNVPAELLRRAIRTATLKHDFVPVLCGSALKNKGIQPLLDAIVAYLPSPTDVHYDFVSFYNNELCALAFKIIHDKQRGPLTFARIYSGQMSSNSEVHNVNRACTEKISRLVEVYADEYKDAPQADPGCIVAISGLRETITGDTLVSSAKSVVQAKKAYQRSLLNTEPLPDHADDSTDNTEVSDTVDRHDPVLAGLRIPDPVFLCAIEPASMSQQQGLEHALACLTREDPSLRVTVNEDTGQTILSGMGELHLEIIHDRILEEYNVDADLGEVFIAYREALTSTAEETFTLDRVLGNQRHTVTVCASVESAEEVILSKTDAKFHHRIQPHAHSSLKEKPIRMEHRKAVKNGVLSALSRGPLLHFPVVDVCVSLHDLKVARGTSLPMVTAAVAQCITQAFSKANPVLLEPIMALEIHVPEMYLGAVMKDLTQRRSQIEDIRAKGDTRTLLAMTPLSELMGYSTTMRTFTSGTVTFSMELHSYQGMSKQHEQASIAKARGLL